MSVKIKRIYEDPHKNDGIRILVDRIWPRGLSKEDAKLDDWMKEVGPSSELRKWFNHDPDKFVEFKEKYKEELKSGTQQEELKKLKDITKKHHKKVTLVYAAKDKENNQAKVLKEILDRQKVE